MAAPRKYDPQDAEKRFVTGDMSIRALAAEVGVSFSTLAAYARDNDWRGKRIAYKNSLSRQTYDKMAAEVADEKAQIHTEMIAVLRATLRVYAQRLRDGEVPVGTKDAVETVKQLATLLGDPMGGDNEPRNVTPQRGESPDADFLRRAIEAARRRLASGAVLEGAAAEQPPGTRPN